MLIEAEARNFKNCSIKDVDILIPNFTAKNNGKRLKMTPTKVEYIYLFVFTVQSGKFSPDNQFAQARVTNISCKILRL